jgi:hypothetical protein
VKLGTVSCVGAISSRARPFPERGAPYGAGGPTATRTGAVPCGEADGEACGPVPRGTGGLSLCGAAPNGAETVPCTGLFRAERWTDPCAGPSRVERGTAPCEGVIAGGAGVAPCAEALCVRPPHEAFRVRDFVWSWGCVDVCRAGSGSRGRGGAEQRAVGATSCVGRELGGGGASGRTVGLFHVELFSEGVARRRSGEPSRGIAVRGDCGEPFRDGIGRRYTECGKRCDRRWEGGRGRWTRPRVIRRSALPSTVS